MMVENPETLIWLGLKLMTMLGLGIYIVFSLVVVRQEQLMSRVLEAQSERILSLIAWIHLIAAGVIFILALLIL